MSRAAIAAIAVVGACSEPKGATQHESISSSVERDAAPGRLASTDRTACLADAEQVTALWTRLEHALKVGHAAGVDAVVAIAAGEVRRIHADDRAFEGQSFPVDARRTAVFASYLCGGHSEGGVLLLVAEREPGWWAVVDRQAFPAGAYPEVVAASGTGLLVVSSSLRTQDTLSRLWLFHADGDAWRVPFDRDGLIGLKTDVQGEIIAARWREHSSVFGTSVDGPMPAFEVNLSLDGSTPPEVRSLAPWLTTIEEACRTEPDNPRIACGEDTAIVGTRVVGRYAAVTFQGPGTRVRCGDEAIGSAIVEDVAVVVDLQRAGDAWQILDRRPVDRGCAATAAAGSAGPFVSHHESYYRADGDYVVEGRGTGQVRRIANLRDEARLLARDAGTFYWISAESGRVRRLVGDEPETLDEGGFDVAGLAAHNDAVYWSVYGRGEIRRHQAGRVETVATGLDMPMGLAFHGDVLLVASASGLIAVNLATGSRTTMDVEALAPVSVAAEGDTVVWSEAGGRVMASTGGVTKLVADQAAPLHVAISNHVITWRDRTSGRLRQRAAAP